MEMLPLLHEEREFDLWEEGLARAVVRPSIKLDPPNAGALGADCCPFFLSMLLDHGLDRGLVPLVVDLGFPRRDPPVRVRDSCECDGGIAGAHQRRDDVCCWPASGSVENMAGDRVPGGHWSGR